jgi:hypothetical protein
MSLGVVYVQTNGCAQPRGLQRCGLGFGYSGRPRAGKAIARYRPHVCWPNHALGFRICITSCATSMFVGDVHQ